MTTRNGKIMWYINVFFLFSAFCFAFEAENFVSLSQQEKIDKEKIFTDQEKDIAKKYPNYFTIDESSIKIELKEIKEIEMDYKDNNKDKDGENLIVTLEKIVNIAKKLWDIVVANQPVSNIETKYAVAYPEGITSPQQLSNWKKPKIFLYGFYASNLYGVRVVDVEYEVIYTYGGDYKGKGKFLTAVSVVPTKVDVAFGYRFNMHSYVPDSTVVNIGTSKDPIAAMQLKLTWKISTFLKDSTNTSVYYIQGDGYFSEIASPFNKGIENSFIAPLLNKKNFEEVFKE